jgi:protein-tyrosine phosphatase
MAPQFVIVFVCGRNVCLSPVAAHILRQRLQGQLGRRRDLVSVLSAGLEAMVGEPMDPMAARQLAGLGVPAEPFTARQLTESVATDADLLLTATKDLRYQLLVEVPTALRRTFTITEFAALVAGADAGSPEDLVADAAHRRSCAKVLDYDIPDPSGDTGQVYRKAVSRVDYSVSQIADAIVAAFKHSGAVRVP